MLNDQRITDPILLFILSSECEGARLRVKECAKVTMNSMDMLKGWVKGASPKIAYAGARSAVAVTIIIRVI